MPPALELRASGTLASSILAAIPQYLRAKSAIYIIKGNYTLPSLITEDVPNNLLKDYFFVEDHQTDPDEAKQKTEKRTIADVSARLLQSSHQAIQGLLPVQMLKYSINSHASMKQTPISRAPYYQKPR